MTQRKAIGVRLNKELEEAMDDVIKHESVDKSTALRMLVGEGYREWRLKRALQQLRDRRVSVWQASKMAGMTLWDFTARVKKEGIEWVDFDLQELLKTGQS